MTARVPSTMTNRSRLVALASAVTACLLAASTATLPGCASYSPGGDGVSRDAFTFASTSHDPKTVQLKDTRTGEVLWTYEIPVDRELVVRFYPGRNSTNLEMPDEMRWEEWEKDRRHGSLENKMPVPHYDYRRLDVTIRKPEPAPTRAENP